MAQEVREQSSVLTDEPISWLDSISRNLVTNVLEKLEHGHLQIITADERLDFGNPGSSFKATMHVTNTAAFKAIALGGSVGAGEAYIDGLWTSPDITQLIRLFVKNLSIVDQMEGGTAKLFNGFLNGIYRFTQKNTQTGSRKNIAAHYDLGNDMFELFLDETMMYSSAIYPSETTTLHDAQLHRLQHVGEKLQLSPNDHLLEIGSG